MHVTLQTIADAVGVSRTTVSNAYNRPDQLAPALRERILATAHALGYAGPDPAARRLRSGRRDAVGALLGGGLDDPGAVQVLQGIARTLDAAALGLLLLPARADVRDAVVGALCVYALPADHPQVAAAVERGLRLVAVDAPRLPGHAYVGCDDRAGARAAVEHVLGLGHRRLAVYGSGAERLAGYREAVERAGLAWRDVARIRAPADAAGATAVLATSDHLALAVLAAGAGVAVVGFGDVPDAATRGLTTVRRPLRRMGEVAGELLAGGTGAREVILPVELVVRGSTAAPL